MNAVVDIGNSRTKIGLFKNQNLLQVADFAYLSAGTDFLHSHAPSNILIASVGDPAGIEMLPKDSRILVLNPDLPLPLAIAYETNRTLGADRIAAACGAAARFPGENCLVIDLGTCINYELVTSDRVYRGGAISPGVRMRFRSMHEQTARLPLAEPVVDVPIIGQSTISCLQSGVLNGVAGEVNGMIARFEMQCNGPLHVILCGGDAQLFENQLKPPIFVAPNLVLEGLNSILEHNVAA